MATATHHNRSLPLSRGGKEGYLPSSSPNQERTAWYEVMQTPAVRWFLAALSAAAIGAAVALGDKEDTSYEHSAVPVQTAPSLDTTP